MSVTLLPIVALTLEDRDWVFRVADFSKSILGPIGLPWSRSWPTPGPRDFWVGIREAAFAHYRLRLDGIKVLDEIAVHPHAKGLGLGRELVEHIGCPMELKTDADNAESNGFYRHLGFKLAGQKTSKNGKKLFNIYRKL